MKEFNLRITQIFLTFFLLYYGNVDDAFPIVTFNFKGSLSLTVYPHEYLFKDRVSTALCRILLIIVMCYSLVSNQPECFNAQSACLKFSMHVLNPSFNASWLPNWKYVVLNGRVLSELSYSSFSLKWWNYYSYYFLFRFLVLNF